MGKKWKLRAISWIMSAMMILTSSGIDSLVAMAAEEEAAPVEQQVEFVESVSEEEVETAEAGLASVTGEGFSCSVDFEESYTAAVMTVTLEKIGENAPNGSNSIDCYIKMPSENSYTRQFTWNSGFDGNNQAKVDVTQYDYQPLTPNTSYDIKISLRHENNIIGSAETSFTTKPINITAVMDEVTWLSAKYHFEVADQEELTAAGVTELVGYPYIQEKNGELKRDDVYSVDFLKQAEIEFTKLKDDTEYTVIFGGTRDSATPSLFQYDFKTAKDSRTLSATENEIQYCYAKFDVAMKGGRTDVDSKLYLFYRKKGETQWYTQVQHEDEEEKRVAFSKQFTLNELDSLTEYEYVIGLYDEWNVNDPATITKEAHKIAGTFTTPADPRELKAVCSAGYRTALIKASYTDNDLNKNSVVHAFVREKGSDEWAEQKKSSNDAGNSFDLVFKDLKMDTEYEYRVILNSKDNGTTADDDVKPLQYQSGSFKTDVCKYNFTMAPDTTKSLYNREYLNVQLKDSKADREVEVAMVFSNEVEKTVSLYRDEDYKDIFSIKNLESDTKYYLAQYSLWVNEYGEKVCIKEVTCAETDYAFTTPVAVAPTSVTFKREAVYLNVKQPEEKNVGFVVLNPIVNEGASNEMLWKSLDETVATVDKDGKVTAKKIGETQIVATSKYNEAINATVTVHVDSFEAIYADNQKAVGDGAVKGLKGTESDAIIVNGVSEAAEITGYSVERNSVVKYDLDTHKIAFGAVGISKLYLEVNEYKVRINTESYVKTAAYYVDSIENTTYPGVKDETKENTFILAPNQTYDIKIKAIDGSDVKGNNKFDITVESNINNSISLNDKNLKLTTTDVTSAPVKITISPKAGSEFDNEYYSDAVIYVNVKALPEQNDADMYVYINEDKYLSDVDLKSGWSWENETVALYTLRNTQTYDFKAYYAKDDKYPSKQTIHVALAEIKSFTIEDLSKTNYSVTADGTDKILVKLSYTSVGKLRNDDLTMALTCKSKDCVIALVEAKDKYAIYEISANKPGKYTLAADLNSANYGKAILTTGVDMKANKNPYVRSILVQNTSLEIPEFLEEDTLLLDATLDLGKTVTLKAVTYDYKENEINAPALTWTTTDNSVVQIAPVSKTDTQNANLLVKGEGNAIITVQSTDEAAASYTFVVEVKNLAPHVDGSKVTVNTALDYTISEGRDIAYKFNGFTELVEAYDNEVTEWDVYKKTQKTFEKEKEVGLAPTAFDFYERFGVGNKRDILAMPKDADMKTGKQEVWLAVKTEATDVVYAYPVTINVVNKPMKVKAVSDNINTFYMLRNNDNIVYTFTGDYINNPTVNWIDDAKDAIGFGIGKYVYYNNTKKKWCSAVDTSALEMNGRVPAAGTTSGLLELTFKGYRESVKIQNFKIKATYKIPVITAVDAQSTISTQCGINQAAFYLYQKDAKERIKFKDEENKYRFSSYKSNIEEVEIEPTSEYSEYIRYTYTGDNKSEKLVVSLRSNYWREKVEVKHTINNVVPVLILEKPNMTFNWNLPGMDTTVLKVKKSQNGAVLKDVIVTGKNAEAQKLIDENIFTFTLDEQQHRYLDAKLNYLQALNKKMTKDSAYSFNVTPVYVNTVTGEEVTGKPCALKIKTTAKNPEVSVSASGSIDLGKYPVFYGNENGEFYKNAVRLKYSFKNVNSNYEEVKREVVGDYANYFEIRWSNIMQGFYLAPKKGMEGKLKAGFVYNIQFKFTLKMKDGVTAEIVSAKPYKLKLKQSTVGLKIVPKTQIMYLSNEKVTRDYEVSVNNGFYHIDSITGGLDVNQDGKADFVIDKVQKHNNDMNVTVTIRLMDRDAVSTTLKGKNYSIPVEIMVTGADGVSKNIKMNITVTVKK